MCHLEEDLVPTDGLKKLLESRNGCPPLPSRKVSGCRVTLVEVLARWLVETEDGKGRPLDLGKYRIRPECVTVTSSNYVLDGEDGLSFARRGFMPPEDWRFSWDVPTRCHTS